MTTWYCPLPFKHAFIDTGGISPCCATTSSFNINTTIQDWGSHPKLIEFQQQFLNGESPAACIECKRQEKIQNKSLRLDALRDYNDEIFTNTQLEFIHYSQSNICNFKCRSCNPRYSHGIANEFKNNPILLKLPGGTKKEQLVSVSTANQEWIIDNITAIRRIMITGGEPTVMPEIRKLFEYLKNNPQPQLQIMITTNGSWTDNFWYEVIQSCPNLHITISIDGVGSTAELVRHGTVWPQVEYNLKWLAKNSYSLDINTVISRLNILHLYPILKLCCEARDSSTCATGGKNGDLGLRHQFSICNYPLYMTITNFPDAIKTDILAHLTHCLELDLDEEQRMLVNGLIATVTDSTHNEKLWNETEQYQFEFDRIRNEDHTQLYLT